MLAAWIFLVSSIAIPSVNAQLIDTATIVEQQRTETTRAELKALLEREEVRQQLLAWDVAPELAEQRIDALTDAELHELAQHMEELPAGAGVVNALLLVFLVLLVTDILGVTDIFPFVRGAGSGY
ncbi:hypothetical protein CAI21_17795 [Alkalilimnicola ehrlichii]|uniref:PA2779 family protein n=1 Tax=Alkalilimnicola ehrlichii TaxID=351052 RepID=A0A3E0WGX6_9GAMM|nr:hypothetical protein CAI21_17795 [Alkalilimnicola ehrlichii]RFA31699.1 hypothetical protein CAL65_21695 [Alkalilimnicola ehrlichii]